MGYVGFAKLKGQLAAKGATSPGGLAAYIGKKKYGGTAFKKAAASHQKMRNFKTLAKG